MFEFIDISSA